MFVFLKDYMTDHEQQKLIEVDANLPAKAVFKVSDCVKLRLMRYHTEFV